MAEDASVRDPRHLTGPALDEGVVAALRANLPAMAGLTVAAVTAEVPSYAGAFSGRMGRNIENAVQMALGALLLLAGRPGGDAGRSPLPPALDAAYELGRGEARQGRSMDALLAAYRVGARVAWREMSQAAVAGGAPADTVARFAELAFAFIDELSAASIAGHADELTTSGRVRQRYLDQLGQSLLTGDAQDVLAAAAGRADWKPPATLTAAVLQQAKARGLVSQLGQATLEVAGNLPGAPPGEELVALLVPDVDGPGRARLAALLEGRGAVLGPARPWGQVRASYLRALRARTLATGGGTLDTEEHLVELVLGADPEAAADLRRRALAPLAGLRPNTADRLAETLLSWLLHQGQRDAVAAELFVHAQTVRYRMTQLRELYGDRLADPRAVLELVVALAAR